MSAFTIVDGRPWYQVGSSVTDRDVDFYKNSEWELKDGYIQMKPWSQEKIDAFNAWNKFDPASIPEYMAGNPFDCTTLAKAAEAGCLEFLQWCYKQNPKEFGGTVFCYALAGRQLATAEWLLTVDLDWEESRAHLDRMREEGLELGVAPELVPAIGHDLQASAASVADTTSSNPNPQPC